MPQQESEPTQQAPETTGDGFWWVAIYAFVLMVAFALGYMSSKP